MIDLYTWTTPNGRKVSILLEELGVPYTVHSIDISKDEQHAPDFLKIAPNNRIPAIVDTETGQTLMESGAIMLYLADKYQKFQCAGAEYWRMMEWLMWQVGGIGPMMGQANHFRRYAPDRIEYAVDRYANETKRLFGVADTRLGKTRYLAGNDYTIADIAAYPWMRNWKGQEVPLDDYPNTKRWLEDVGERPAVKSGLEVLIEHRSSGPPKGKAWDVMFGKEQFKRR